MKPQIAILALLIGAFAAGDTALVLYVRSSYQTWPDLPGVILLGLVFGQITLVSAWFVFARWNIAVRVLMAVAAVFGLSQAGVAATTDAPIWFAILLVAFCSTVVPLAVTRIFRWQIGSESSIRGAGIPDAGIPDAGIPDAVIQSQGSMPGWQFSIWSLLSGTTAVALGLATARRVSMPLLEIGEAVGFFCCLAVIGVMVFFVVMGIKHVFAATLVTAFVVFVLCPLGGLLLAQTGLPPEDDVLEMVLCSFCQGASIAVTGCVLRITGLRLSRRALAPLDEENQLGKGRRAATTEDKLTLTAGPGPRRLAAPGPRPGKPTSTVQESGRQERR